jgi:GNAT superfamily N-acetyltransferase
MIGFGRLITDYVSFAYLTDVYVLPEHQGKGLAKWMMQCLDEILDSWPELRRTLLLTGDPSAVRLYEKTLGM